MRSSLKFFLIVLIALQIHAVKAQNVTIDFSKENQIIRGFGGINFPAWIGDLNQDMREKAFSNNPGEIGLSILRMQVPPDSTQFDRELATAAYATEQGATLFASPWNPPTSIREVRGQFNTETDYMIPAEHYGEYANHLNSFVAYMETNDVPLYAISIQNEPDWHGWTTWKPNEMVTFLKENAPDINCKIIAPESFQYTRSTIDPLLKDSAANAQIDILGTHLYGTQKSNFYYPLAYEKGKEIWMTEHLLGSDKVEDNTWALAMEIADEINLCMDANMSAYVYWYIRRFYGLIDEAGNITDKGYVLSQFSKFIRPGFHRVDASYKVANNVTATAFKSDSSVVIVVVNKTNNSIDLNFALENNIAGIDSLTQFTTSASKKVTNDGALQITDGTFSAKVDAMSITTFTSNSAKGAKFGNQAPVASVGTDLNIEILDSLGVGSINYQLKGSESTDADGEIVKYSWSQNGSQISTEPDMDLTLEIGNYEFVLTVTDNDGAISSATVKIAVTNNNTAEIWFEAECTEVGPNWQLLDDAKASNGKYLTVTPGIQSSAGASADTLDHLVYNFYAPESGNYKVWGRVLAPTADDDSYWVKIDDGDWAMWNGIVGSSSWGWDDVHGGSNDNNLIYALDTGFHKLTVTFREDGAAIDKFYITNTGQTPVGLGDDAATCEFEEPEEPNGVELINSSSLKVYPNPVKSNLSIESKVPFIAVNIYNLTGEKVLSRSFNTEQYSTELPIDLKGGIYMLHVITNSQSVITKFLVEE